MGQAGFLMGAWLGGWSNLGEVTTDGTFIVLAHIITRDKPLVLPFLTPQNDEVPNV